MNTKKVAADRLRNRAAARCRIVAILLLDEWPSGAVLYPRQRELLIANAQREGHDISEALA